MSNLTGRPSTDRRRGKRTGSYRFCRWCGRRYWHQSEARRLCRLCHRAAEGHAELDREFLERVREAR
jgi:hypothetical protein